MSDPRNPLHLILGVLLAGLVALGFGVSVKLGCLLVAAAGWALWAGSLVWSERYDLGDDLLRAGLVGVYPAAVAGGYALGSGWSPSTPFLLVPGWVSIAASVGAAIGLLVLWARASADPAREGQVSPAAFYAAGLVGVTALVGTSVGLYSGAGVLKGIPAGLALSFPVAGIQGLTRWSVGRRASARRLRRLLVLPWLTLSGLLLAWTLYGNSAGALLRTHLGEVPPTARNLRVEEVQRGIFDNHVRVSFDIDAPELRRLLARRGLKPGARGLGWAPPTVVRYRGEDFATYLDVDRATGRATLVYRTAFSF